MFSIFKIIFPIRDACHLSELVGMTAELNVYKGSPKSENKLKEMVLTIYNESGFQLFFFS